MSGTSTNRPYAGDPNINVTPLIDVLLVLLIIFMVVTPLRPSGFKAHVPQPPPQDEPPPPSPPDALVVTVDDDLQLKLNGISGMGSVNDTGALSARLADVFRERAANRAYKYGMENRQDLSIDRRIERTVMIKAPRLIRYGEVVKVIDGIKAGGAEPIGLQIDGLN